MSTDSKTPDSLESIASGDSLGKESFESAGIDRQGLVETSSQHNSVDECSFSDNDSEFGYDIRTQITRARHNRHWDIVTFDNVYGTTLTTKKSMKEMKYGVGKGSGLK
jgi:hypothetical protein